MIENTVPSPITNSSLSTVGNICYVYGGTDMNGACFNDIRFIDVSEYLNANDITVNEGSASDYNFKILIIGDAGIVFINNNINKIIYLLIFLFIS